MVAKIQKRSFRVGDTIHVFLGTTEDNFTEKIKALLVPNGHAVVAEDGSSKWIIDVEVFDSKHDYIWDRTGGRVKHARTLYEKDSKGSITKKVLRYIYKAPEL